MVIFRIFFNLFRMASRLLFLPLHLLTHNFMLIVILIAVLIAYRTCSHSTTSGPAPMQPQLSPQEANPPAKQGQIDPIRRREDGDSAFATDLYASMTDGERNYYSQMFFSVMSNVEDDKPFQWQAVNIAGTLTPGATFYNNDGKQCRHFKEVLKVHSIEQTLTGTACDRGDGGWCKLKPNATPSCGLSSGSHGGILDMIRGLF